MQDLRYYFRTDKRLEAELLKIWRRHLRIMLHALRGSHLLERHMEMQIRD